MIYDTEERTYLFDLDFASDMDCPFTVDAGSFGNVAHFVNHSVSALASCNAKEISITFWFKKILKSYLINSSSL